MRKAVWYCGAAAVAVAGACYFAADYANRHPQTLIGRCLVVSYELGTGNYPLEPASSCPAGPELARCPAVSDDEEFRLPGRIVIEDEAARAPQPFPLAFEESEEPAMLVPSVKHESPAPLTMPYADEDEKAPATMPYADSDEPAHKPSPVVSFWRQFFGCDTERHGKTSGWWGTWGKAAEAGEKCVPHPECGAQRSQSFKFSPTTLEKDLCWPCPPVDTLDLRPSDMKQYRFQPLPF